MMLALSHEMARSIRRCATLSTSTNDGRKTGVERRFRLNGCIAKLVLSILSDFPAYSQREKGDAGAL